MGQTKRFFKFSSFFNIYYYYYYIIIIYIYIYILKCFIVQLNVLGNVYLFILKKVIEIIIIIFYLFSFFLNKDCLVAIYAPTFSFTVSFSLE